MFIISTMVLADYDAVMDLMRGTPGVSIRDADSRASTARYLERNPGLSFVARIGEETVGCIMSGHDGRRGYLQHLVVSPQYRRQGIANALVASCVAALAVLGIHKSHIDVLKTNPDASAYWERQGWQLRTDIHRYSFIGGGGKNV
jgi:ribosomal protein S18 acetylase RimI-like enzyme